MLWSPLWKKLSLVGTEQANSKEDFNRIILLNRFVGLATIPIIISLFIYALLGNWLMFNTTLVGGAICGIVLLSIAIYGKEIGWHIGLTFGISFLVILSLLVKYLFASAIILCSFVHLVNYIYLKSNIRFLYYGLLFLAILIVLVNPNLPISVSLENAYGVNIIFGSVGVVFQIFFSMLYAKDVEVKDTEIEKRQSRIQDLLSVLQEKNASLEKTVKKRTQRLIALNEELKRSNLDLNEFACAASHDLKEPLRTIASFLKILEKRNGDQIDELGKEYLNYAIDGAKRMSNLIKDILEYSQVKTGATKMKPCSFQQILERKILDLDKKIKEKNATIVYDGLPESMCCVPNQIGVLIYNLINNALKFNESERPTIIIKGQERANDWLFAVSDNGIGIDEKDQEIIFDVFHRLHSKATYEGSGIGLAICKKIVTRHEGEIWLESIKDKGTTFFFTVNKYPVSIHLSKEVA